MRNRFGRAIGLLVMSAALLLVAAPSSVLAEERTCRGTLGSITVDNLRVPQGCLLYTSPSPRDRG